MQGTQGFREGGKRDPGKVRSSPASGPSREGVPRREEDTKAKWGNPLSSGKGWIPSRKLQPLSLRKRRGGQRALSSGRWNADTFRGRGASRCPTSRGRQGCPMGDWGDARLARGSMRRSRVLPDEHPSLVRPVPRASTAGAARVLSGGGGGEWREGWDWDSPLLRDLH